MKKGALSLLLVFAIAKIYAIATTEADEVFWLSANEEKLLSERANSFNDQRFAELEALERSLTDEEAIELWTLSQGKLSAESLSIKARIARFINHKANLRTFLSDLEFKKAILDEKIELDKQAVEAKYVPEKCHLTFTIEAKRDAIKNVDAKVEILRKKFDALQVQIQSKDQFKNELALKNKKKI